MCDKLEVGFISTTHGLKGEVKAVNITDDVRRFEKLKRIYIGIGGEEKGPYGVEYVKYFNGRPILKLKGLDRIEDVEKMKGGRLLIERKDAVTLKQGEYFIGDLIGYAIYSEDEKKLGILSGVMKTGANDVYEMTADDGKETLIPAISDCIIGIEPENRRMTVRLLPEI